MLTITGKIEFRQAKKGPKKKKNSKHTKIIEGLLPLLQEAFQTFQMHLLALCQMLTMKGHR